MFEQKHTYFVSGRLFLREVGAADGFQWPGLVDVVTLNPQFNTISLPNRATPGGGNHDEIRRLESMGVTINCREFNPKALATLLAGHTADVTGDSVTDEEHAAYPGRFIPLDHPGPYTSLSVTDDDEGSPVTIPAGDNYEIVPGGLVIKEDAQDITAGDTILVSYTHPAYARVNPFTRPSPIVEAFFAGQNEAKGNLPVEVHMFRLKLGAPEEIALLSADDFGAMQVTGELLADATKTGANESQFFVERWTADES